MTNLIKINRRHTWLSRFLRLLREEHISEFKVDWQVVSFFLREGRSCEEAIYAIKDSMYKKIA